MGLMRFFPFGKTRKLHTQTRLPLKHNPRYKRNGTASYLYTLRKYGIHGMTPPEQATVFINKFNRLAVRDEKTKVEIGEVPTENFQNDSFYLCPVSIGEGGAAVTVDLDFDTGSSDLWGTIPFGCVPVDGVDLFSSLLPKKIPTTGHHVYNPKKSLTAKVMAGSKWNISYGDGSYASGVVYTDTVTVGGITIKNQAVECATNMSSAFSDGTGDGLLGLAFGNINTVTPKPVATPVTNMGDEKVIPPGEQVFTCALTRHDENPGFYTFGYIDTADFGSETPFYTPIIDQSGFWKISSMTAYVNGQKIDRSGNTAIADTGTTLCLVDKALCDAIYAQVPGSKYDSQAQGYVYPISVTESSLPTIQIAIGDPNGAGEKAFDIMPRDLGFAEASPGWVYGGFQDRGPSMNFDILGDVFLKNLYAIWDVRNNQFGAVARTPGPFTTTTPTIFTQGKVGPPASETE